MQENVKYTKELKQKLNEDLKNYFPHLFLVDDDMEKSFTSVSRLILLDRYAQKDIKQVVAYSSVSHMGVIILGTFALNVEGITGSIFLMIIK